MMEDTYPAAVITPHTRVLVPEATTCAVHDDLVTSLGRNPIHSICM
jgi:hypothetical protein